MLTLVSPLEVIKPNGDRFVMQPGARISAGVNDSRYIDLHDGLSYLGYAEIQDFFTATGRTPYAY